MKEENNNNNYVGKNLYNDYREIKQNKQSNVDYKK